MIHCATHCVGYRQLVEKRGNIAGASKHPRSTAFLLAQVGAHAAARFAERLQQIELVPAQAGILRAVAGNSGTSQQSLASQLGMAANRLVPLLDELEGRGLLERREHAADRRLNALHLTEKGSTAMADIGRVARAHDDSVCASLSAKEREQLSTLLGRIADDQKLTPGVHPGFARIGDGGQQPRGGKTRVPKTR
jgi:DNA-binding MarR family transcriptional regulator